MTVDICPTVTAETVEEYDRQLAIVSAFANRIHLDASDGTMTSRVLLNPADFHWPDHVRADIHLMSLDPEPIINRMSALSTNLIIFHAEARIDSERLIDLIHQTDAKAGIALLPETSVKTISDYVQKLDHVLIFSGNLGYQGGSAADLSLLNKANLLLAIRPELEIGWDGGVNNDNIRAIKSAGIRVINAGGFIQTASDPANAYATLKTVVE